MMNEKFSIYPLDVGTLVGFNKTAFLGRQRSGVKIDAPCISFAIKGEGRNILIDTGPCKPDRAAQYHCPLKKEPSQEIDLALGKIGLKPKDIDTVIFTHLHWDHCYNVEHFTDATYIVQKTELEYAVDPLPPDRAAYDVGIPGFSPPWMKVFDRIKVVDGNHEIIPGISVMHLPGHTPGFQGVSVATAKGPWLVAGDLLPLYENLNAKFPAMSTPNGYYQNLFNYYGSLKKVGPFGNQILPGHDAKVLERTCYP